MLVRATLDWDIEPEETEDGDVIKYMKSEIDDMIFHNMFSSDDLEFEVFD